MLCSVLEDDDCSDETTHVVKIDQDVAESVEGVHFAYCLSEVGCGIIRADLFECRSGFFLKGGG